VTETFEGLQDGELIRLFWAAVVVSLIAPRLPYGRWIVYPFSLLSTWAHEMGHGLTAIAFGGSFHRLELWGNLEGVAWFGGVGPLRRAIVAAGGLLAPAMAGGIIIILGAREATAPFILTGLAVLVWVSIFFFVRNRFGMAALTLIGMAMVLLALRAPEPAKIFVAQLIGIQFCIASWGSMNYMFTKNFRDHSGAITDSDTQAIANVLLLPYWFWGTLIAATSLAILGGSFYLAWLAEW